MIQPNVKCSKNTSPKRQLPVGMLWPVFGMYLILMIPGTVIASGSKSFNYIYVTDYFEVPLDHFSLAQNSTFKIRYLYNDTFWKRADKGPILFYTGNEGGIESFANNTGFMWELSEELGAMVVFAEHRFYGQSFPEDFFFEDADISVLGYLTVEQVLADFAKLITALRKSFDAEQSPVISFGGSYGGQLTAYLRMKYPHIVQGAIAASAPLFFTDALCELHDKVLTSVFTTVSKDCSKTVRKSWSAINEVTKTEKGKEWLASKWNLCNPIASSDNVTTLKSWLETMYYDMAMVNYPYEANFLRDLPANPVKTFCSKIEPSVPPHVSKIKSDTKEDLLARLYHGINMYYNHSGEISCFNYADVDDTGDGFSEMDAQSFDYQTCTELIAPMCDDGIEDFFEPEKWDLKEWTADCREEFGPEVTPTPERLDLFYGGWRSIMASSNIIFSNGLLDPWFAYGVLKNVSESVFAIIIDDGAHHMDLRASNPMDPTSVLVAREFEKNMIRKWILEFHENDKRIKELQFFE